MSKVTVIARIVLVGVGVLASLVCSYFVCLSVFREVRSATASLGGTNQPAKKTVNAVSLTNGLNWRPSTSSSLPLSSSAPSLKDWGTFRPGYYFGLKSKTPRRPWVTGFLWSDTSRVKYRHTTEQDDISKFEWIRHDGESFGTQELLDKQNRLSMETSFIIPDHDVILHLSDNHRNLPALKVPSWLQKITIKPLVFSATLDNPILWYMGLDTGGDRNDPAISDNAISNLRVIKEHPNRLHVLGHTSHLGSFCLTLQVVAANDHEESTEALRLSYISKRNIDAHGLVEQLTSNRRDDGVYDGLGDLTGSSDGSDHEEEGADGHALAIQLVNIKSSSEIYISLYDHLEEGSSADVLHQQREVPQLWGTLYTQYLNIFEQKFDSTYLTNAQFPDSLGEHKDSIIEASKRCLSSLLGGIGYFEGVPQVNHGVDIHPNGTEFSPQVDLSKSLVARHKLSLYSATPSRSIFPRGFLWDEGFHQLVISKWSEHISFNVIQSWLNNLYVFTESTELLGWIPREMILGGDAEKRVPGEFIPQRVNIVNPPTFLLVLEQFITQCKEQCSSDTSVLNKFLMGIYPRLVVWVRGLLVTQEGAEPGSFRWRGRSQSDQKFVPNTLASGLDDYPRGLFVHYEEKHVDLHCWAIKALQVVDLIESYLDMPKEKRFLHFSMPADDAVHMLERKLDEIHWSDEYRGYYDVGVNNESAVFVQEVLFRCGNPNTRQAIDGFVPVYYLQQKVQFCPPSHPQPVSPIGDGQGGYMMRETLQAENFTLNHVARVGYTSLFPLLLKLLPPYSPKLGSIMAVMEDSKHLFTDFGLRSISASDKFYLKKNSMHDEPYWRGPIWLNINYLALGALKHYASQPGPHQQRAHLLYTKLHRGIVSNVFKAYRDTGFFWEQYEDKAGVGMRGHPFTGWTSTIVNILYEIY